MCWIAVDQFIKQESVLHWNKVVGESITRYPECTSSNGQNILETSQASIRQINSSITAY